MRCTDNGVGGWKWGESGKCYTGPNAKEKALEQGQAVEASKIADQKEPTDTQSYIFLKEKFTKEQAVKWTSDHDKKYNNIEETADSWRLRQVNPERFKPESFKTIKIEAGVKAVIGKLKDSVKDGDTIFRSTIRFFR